MSPRTTKPGPATKPGPKVKRLGYLPADVVRAHIEAGNGIPGHPLSKGLRERGARMGVIMSTDAWFAAIEAMIVSKVLHFQRLRAVLSED